MTHQPSERVRDDYSRRTSIISSSRRLVMQSWAENRDYSPDIETATSPTGTISRQGTKGLINDIIGIDATTRRTVVTLFHRFPYTSHDDSTPSHHSSPLNLLVAGTPDHRHAARERRKEMKGSNASNVTSPHTDTCIDISLCYCRSGMEPLPRRLSFHSRIACCA